MYYNVAGKHEKHVSLPSKAGLVCCSADYIFSSSQYGNLAVHVYSWRGVLIQTLSHQQLGIRKDHSISAIQCNKDGTVLQLAIVTRGGRTLRAYKVRCSLMLSYTMYGFIGCSVLGEDEVNNINAIRKA